MEGHRLMRMPVVLGLLCLVSSAIASGQGRAVMQRACASCHGIDGAVPTDDGIPVLSGLDRRYLDKQIHDLKIRPGETAPRRVNPRARSGDALSEGEVVAVTGWLATQAWPGDPVLADASSVAALYREGDAVRGIPACLGCHGAGALGNPAMGAPRLAGQKAGYLRNQLRRFASGERANSPSMRAVAAALGEEDIDQLAHFLAGEG